MTGSCKPSREADDSATLHNEGTWVFTEEHLVHLNPIVMRPIGSSKPHSTQQLLCTRGIGNSDGCSPDEILAGHVLWSWLTNQ